MTPMPLTVLKNYIQANTGWILTASALSVNLLSINNILTIIISIASLLFLGFKIHGQILENKFKKKQLDKLDKE